MSYVPRLRKKYSEEIAQNLKTRFEYTSTMQVPRITKVCLNQGLGKATSDKKIIDAAVEEMTLIAGQKAVATLSTKDSITLAILGFLSHLRLATLQWLGLIIGSMAAWFPHGPAWVIRRNLMLCFPEQNERWINQTTKQNLIYTAQTALEFTKT